MKTITQKQFDEFVKKLKKTFPLTKNFHGEYITIGVDVIHNVIDETANEVLR